MSKRYKYPRTPHLPFSPCRTNDDKIIQNLDAFKGKEVVVTEKMDGENTTIYRDTEEFQYSDFELNVCKWVRQEHVDPDNKHWMKREIILNKLRIDKIS